MTVLWRVCWMRRSDVLLMMRGSRAIRTFTSFRFLYLDTNRLPALQASQVDWRLYEVARLLDPDYLIAHRMEFRNFCEEVDPVEARKLSESVDLILYVKHYMEDERARAYPARFLETNYGRYRRWSEITSFTFERPDWVKEGF